MNKSTMLFLGGAALGATITAVALTGGVFVADKVASGAASQQSTDEQLQKLADISADLTITAGALKNSAERLASLRPSNTLAKDAQMSPQSSRGVAVDAEQVSMNINNNQAQPAPAVEPVQPTPIQIDRANEIRSRLAEAANNHGAPLSALIQDAKDLTPEQRQELTNEALDMIKRGELKAEQFTQSSGS